MSGLVNPFAEPEAEPDRAFSFYSDPLAAYTSVPQPALGGRTAAGRSTGGRGRGPPDAAPSGGRIPARGGPPSASPHQPHQHGRSGGGGGRWAPVYSGPPAPSGGYAPGPHGYVHGGWEAPPVAGMAGGYPWPGGGRGTHGAPPSGPWGGRHGRGFGGGPSRPNKWVRTEAPDAGAAAPAAPPVPGRGQPHPGRDDGGGSAAARGGRGRGGRGGRSSAAAGEGSGDVNPAAMQAYYKPSFSADPWARLSPRPLQPAMPGPGGGAARSGPGRHSVDTRKLGGASLAEIMAMEATEDVAEAGADGAAAEEAVAAADGGGAVSGDEPPGEGDEEEGPPPGAEEEWPRAGRLNEEGAQDRPWH